MQLRPSHAKIGLASGFLIAGVTTAAEPMLHPGDGRIDSTVLQPVRVVFDLQAEGIPAALTYDLVLREGRNQNGPALILQALTIQPGETLSDTSCLDRKTLAVHWRNFRFPGGPVGVMKYVGDIARGQVISPEGGEPRVTEVEISGPVFTDAGLPFMLASMEFEENAKFQIPIVSLQAGAAVTLDCTVGAKERFELDGSGAIDVWNVQISGPIGEQTMLISNEPPFLLGATANIAGQPPLTFTLSRWSLIGAEH